MMRWPRAASLLIAARHREASRFSSPVAVPCVVQSSSTRSGAPFGGDEPVGALPAKALSAVGESSAAGQHSSRDRATLALICAIVGE